jgi:catechol 2,3-dioxygenase-like lactoylglutathione lyase family enzyme
MHMKVDDYDSLILYVGDLGQAKAFYTDTLGLPVGFEDEIIVVVGGPSGQIALHRNDRGHDERGIFPAGTEAGAASVRFNVEDPDAWEDEARRSGVPVLWPTQNATWGRFVVVADPDGRRVVLAKMTARRASPRPSPPGRAAPPIRRCGAGQHSCRKAHARLTT